MKIKKGLLLTVIAISALNVYMPSKHVSAGTLVNKEFQGGSSINSWKFWMNSGPYTIFRNDITGEYRMIQTQGTITYMLGVIADGWGQSWHP